MSDNAVIYKFLDNSLNSEQESELLIQLSYNEELRTDFKTILKINSSVSNFKNSIMPPSSLTLNIMKITEHTFPIASNFKSNTKINSSIKYSSISVLSAFIGILCFSYFQFNSILNNSLTMRNTMRNDLNNQKPQIIANQAPIISNKVIKLDNFKDFNKSKSLSIEHPKPDSTLITNLNYSKYPTILTHIIDYNYSYLANNNTLDNKFLPISSDTANTISNFSIEFNNSLNWNLPKETISPSQYSKFNNIQFAIYYDLTTYFKIGADIRQETFYNQYTESDQFGKKYNVQMQPNITSYDLSLRYNLIEFLTVSVSPQFNFGYNSYGYVIRPGINFQKFLFENISFVTTGEYSIFEFKRQNNWFNSKKLSLVFGINYHF